ncbi:hypothetical protein I315_04521 [Cryptococcus gattii Ru294]|nr:hypothetical protein I315_04521 [Cryptococcus gattii Ru294]
MTSSHAQRMEASRTHRVILHTDTQSDYQKVTLFTDPSRNGNKCGVTRVKLLQEAQDELASARFVCLAPKGQIEARGSEAYRGKNDLFSRRLSLGTA